MIIIILLILFKLLVIMIEIMAVVEVFCQNLEFESESRFGASNPDSRPLSS